MYINEKDIFSGLNNVDASDEKAINEYCDEMYRKGRKDKASDIAGRLLKKFPDWSDEKIAGVVEDISSEDVSELRKGIKPV